MAKEEEFIVLKTEEIQLNFYAVRSKDGKWLRSKGYGGSGESWVDDITKAKIYGKPGPAKSQITFWAHNYPTFGVPDLVKITTGKCEFLDQEERVKKSIIAKEKKRLKSEIESWEYLIVQHVQKVKAFRGDGKDQETVRLKKNFDDACRRLKLMEDAE